MATVRVSSSSQLLSALKSAGSGTTIELTSGTYSLATRSGDYHNAVITEAAGAKVTFSKVELRSSSHLTFDGVDFKLPGSTKGVVIANSSDITIRDSNISGPTTLGTVGIFVNNTDNFSLVNNNVTGFATAIKLSSITGLTVQSNDITNTSWDAMIVGGVHQAVFAGNHISLNTPQGRGHTDGMQFYNTGGSPLSDVTIRDNVIETHNSSSHGIYMANNVADTGGGSASFFKNVTITDNTIVSGQVSGIAVGQTSKLSIKDNTILQDTHYHSTREINIPVIRIHHDSTGVAITGNVTHRAPEPSGNNWFPTDKAEPTWTMSGNKIVPLGTTASYATSLAAAAPLAAEAEVAATALTAVSTSADVFRFDAKGSPDVVRGLDLDGGESLVLHDYARGTFHDQAGGNALAVANGTSVTIDHLDDLRELDQASSAVHIREGRNDTLIIDIDQPGPDHVVRILDMAHAYF